jgi:hypothetical protein
MASRSASRSASRMASSMVSKMASRVASNSFQCMRLRDSLQQHAMVSRGFEVGVSGWCPLWRVGLAP